MKIQHWQKNLLLSIGLLGVAMLPAGCGNSLDDQFVFGKNRIHCNGSTITVSIPFEMVADGQQVDLGPRQASRVNAEGHNGHIQVLVTGNKVTEDKNEALLVKDAEEVLKGNNNLSNLTSDKKDVTIGKVPGTLLTFQFTESNRGKKTDLTVKEYIFTYENTVWRVIYQYRTHDEVGKALVDRLGGQIALGSEF
ncbi:MAG TPA: hypothetical protein DDY92_05020 [Dialister sp.]|nr:hypothetical protein [Dialister sp.]